MDFFEKFKVIVFEMTRLLGIQKEGNFCELRVLEIATALKKLDMLLLMANVQDLLTLFAGSLKKTDEDGNTCLSKRMLVSFPKDPPDRDMFFRIRPSRRYSAAPTLLAAPG